jgi:hypothetical protein
LSRKELWRDGRNPTEKLFRVSIVFLGEVLPLPTKALSCGALVAFDVCEIREPWNSGSYRNEEPQAAQRNSPSIISALCDLFTERSKDPSHEGHTRYESNFSFKLRHYNKIFSHKKAQREQKN